MGAVDLSSEGFLVTRYTALLLVSLAALSCSRRTSGPLGIDSTLDSLVPADTIRLYGGSIEALRQTPVYEKYLAKRELPMLDRFRTESGLDPREDLKEFLIANNGKDSVALVRGDFKRGEIEDRLRGDGAERSAHNGVTIWGNRQFGVAFLDGDTAAAGDLEAVRRVIDLRGGKGAIPQQLMDLTESVPRGCQIWGVMLGGPGDLALPERGNLQNLERAFEGVRSLAAGFDLRRGLKVSAKAQFANEADANQVQTALKGLVGIGRFSVPEDKRELLKVYDGIEVRREAALVDVQADIPFTTLDEALKLFDGFAR
jgi:hypothetical protein